MIALRCIYPRFGNMRRDLALEEGSDAGWDAFAFHGILPVNKWHAFGVAEIRVGFRRAVLSPADRGCFIAFAKSREDCLLHRRREFRTGSPCRFR